MRRGGQPLHVTNHVVREVADGPALEAWQPGDSHRLEVAQKASQGLERIAVG